MLTPLEMSISGGILIAVVVIIRALSINRLPKKAFLVLWAVALARLLIPVAIKSPVSFYSAAAQLGVTVDRPGVLTGQVAESAAATAPIPVTLLVWAAVAAVLALLFLVLHLRSRRQYAQSLPVEHAFVTDWLETHYLRRPVRVRYSDRVDAPFTYGILWPVIILPKSLDWTDETRLGFILAHEQAHIRRFDALIKWILAATLCIHWFNPLVWVMYILASRDLELSCDETVVRMYGVSARASYALTLVGMAEKRTHFAPLTSSFSKNAMQERIAAIMKSKKTTVVGIIVALLVVAAVTTVFATAPTQKTSPATAVSSQGGAVIEDKRTTARGTNVIGVEASTAVSDYVYAAESGGTAIWHDGEYPSTYTKEQYNLIAALKTAGYENQSIAEFNRTLNAKFSDGNEDFFEAYDMVLSTLPQDDALAPFVLNTIRASQEEYGARMQEVYSGKRVDPSFRGSASHSKHADVFGDSVEVAYGSADYTFTYRILDQDKLTVGQRDQFLQSMLSGVQAWLEKQDMGKDADMVALKTELDRLGKASTTATIEYTGCEIDYYESYAES